MALSFDEIVSIAQISIAVMCIVAVLSFEYILPFPDDYLLFFLQCALMTTAIICLIFAFSTWYYHSDEPCNQALARLLCAAVLWLCFLWLIITLLWFSIVNLFGKFRGCFQIDIFDGFDLFLLIISSILSWIVAILLLIMAIVLTRLGLKYECPDEPYEDCVCSN